MNHGTRVRLAGSALWLAVAGCSVPPVEPVEPHALERFLEENRELASGEWDELWILDRGSGGARRARSEGGLRTTGARPLALELASVEVGAAVLGRLASVRVRQVFAGLRTDAELDYELPMPEGAAVTDMIVRCGDRRIRAVVRDSEQAERLYRAARRQGLLVSLVSRSDGVFRQRLGSVGRALRIDVEVQYVQAVAVTDGWCELDLPAVPRHAVATRVSVDVEAGAPIDEIDDRDGAFSVRRRAPDCAVLSLLLGTGSPEPCVARWHIAEDGPRGALFVCRDGAGGDPYFLLTTYGSPASVDWGSASPYDVYPEAPAAPVKVGRLRAGTDPAPRFGTPAAPALVVRRAERLGQALPQAWARLRIESLAARSLRAENEHALHDLEDEMRATALEHGMASYLTSLVMVDARSRRD